MVFLRGGIALLLTLLLGAGAAVAADAPPDPIPGLYDRPVVAIDPGMHTAMIRRVAVDADGRWAATGSYDKTVRVWSLDDGALLRTIRLPAGPGDIGKVNAVAMNPDGTLIAAGGLTRWTRIDAQEQIYLFGRENGALARRIDGLSSSVNHLTFSPDGRRTACRSMSSAANCWNSPNTAACWSCSTPAIPAR
jgi:WD40 repeat protein